MKDKHNEILEELIRLKEEKIEKRLEKLEIEYGNIKLHVELLTLGLIFAWLAIFAILILFL